MPWFAAMVTHCCRSAVAGGHTGLELKSHPIKIKIDDWPSYGNIYTLLMLTYNG